MKQHHLILIIVFLGCNNIVQQNPSPVKPEKQKATTGTNILEQDTVTYAARDINDLPKFKWFPHHSNTSSYLCQMEFEDEYAVNFFHGQCAWFFFTYTTAAPGMQQVTLLWTYKTDCILNMSFLEKSNGVKRYPKYGDEFAVYKLINDSTLNVNYNFPGWVDEINKIAGDSLFPKRLYLARPYQ